MGLFNFFKKNKKSSESNFIETNPNYCDDYDDDYDDDDGYYDEISEEWLYPDEGYYGDDGELYDSEEDYFDAIKEDDHYHFSIPFEYIEKNYGNGVYDIGVTDMEIDVDWDQFRHSYVLNYCFSDPSLVDPNESNGDEQEFFEQCGIREELLDKLEAEGISSTIVQY